MRIHTHLGAYAIIKQNNSILLIKKSRGAYTSKLDLPGGKIEHGEEPIGTVIREVYEETGLEVNKEDVELLDAISVNIIWKDIDEEENLHHIGIIYKVDVLPNAKVKDTPDGLDSLGAQWYKIEQLKKSDLSPFAYRAITKY